MNKNELTRLSERYARAGEMLDEIRILMRPDQRAARRQRDPSLGSIARIAARAGVSRATLHRMICGRGGTTPELSSVEQVWEVIMEES